MKLLGVLPLLLGVLPSLVSGAWTVGGDSYAYRLSITTQTANIDANEPNAVVMVPFIGHPIGAKMSDVNDFRFADDANSVLPYETDYIDLSNGLFSWHRVVLDVNATVPEQFWLYCDTASPTDGQADIWDANTIVVWHMQESEWDTTSGEVVDSSGEGNHGTGVGDATTTDSGYFARGGTFDGDGDAISASVDLSTMDEFTIAQWVQMDDWLSTDYETLWANYGLLYFGSAALYHEPVTPTQTQLVLGLVDSDDPGPATVRKVISDTSDLVGWVHIVAVYSSETTLDGSNYMELYVNGSSAGNSYSNTTATWAPDTGRTSVLFGNAYAEPLPFAGQMDEVRIYNRALDANEIKRMYHNDNEQDHELDYGEIEPASTPTPGVIVVPVVDANAAPESDVIQLAGSSPIEGISGELTIDLGAALLILTFSSARLRLEPKE